MVALDKLVLFLKSHQYHSAKTPFLVCVCVFRTILFHVDSNKIAGIELFSFFLFFPLKKHFSSKSRDFVSLLRL